MKINPFLITAVLATAFFCLLGFAQAQTPSVAQLIAQIAQLQAQLQAVQNQQGGTAQAWCHTFNNNLRIGDRNADVSALQNIIGSKEGFSIQDYSAANDGTFTEGTAASVVKFQAKYGIIQTGYVGPITRTKLNSLYGCSAANCVPEGGNIGVGSGISKCCSGLVFLSVSDMGSGKCVNPLKTCIPNWQCGWGPCVNGSQSQAFIDSNNCNNPSSEPLPVPCPALARLCTAQTQCGQLIYFCSDNSPYCQSPYSAAIDQYSQNSGCVQVSKHIISDFKTLNQDPLAVKYGVTGVPTYMYVDRNGCSGDVGKGGMTAVSDITNGIANFKCNTVSPSITITSPNGGEQWAQDSTQNISWTSVGLNDDVVIRISSPDTYAVITTVSASQGSYSWVVGSTRNGYIEPVGQNYKIEITDWANNKVVGTSSEYFSIVAPATPVQPAGIILFYGQGCPHCANVNSYLAANNVAQKVSFTKLEVWSNAANAALMNQKAAVCGLTAIGVPFLWDGSQCYVGDTDVIKYFSKYVSSSPSITVTSPGGGETWRAGETHNIAWQSSNIPSGSYVTIVLQNGINQPFVGTALASLGTFAWTVPNSILPGAYDVSVFTVTGGNSSGGSFVGGSSVIGYSKSFNIVNPSTILPSITITSPLGGEAWHYGETHRITWTSQGVDKVSVYVYNDTVSGSGSTNYLDPAMTSLSVHASQGYFDWTIKQNMLPAGDSSRFKIRVSDVNSQTTGVSASSNYFSISAPAAQPSITISLPTVSNSVCLSQNIPCSIKEDETANLCTAGSACNIAWQAAGVTGNVSVILDHFTATSDNFTTIATIPESANSYLWTVPLDINNNTLSYIYKIKVCGQDALGNSVCSDSSYITLKQPS